MTYNEKYNLSIVLNPPIDFLPAMYHRSWQENLEKRTIMNFKRFSSPDSPIRENEKAKKLIIKIIKEVKK